MILENSDDIGEEKNIFANIGKKNTSLSKLRSPTKSKSIDRKIKVKT
jgi:hypothetical protein